MAGLDVSAAQESIFDYITANAPTGYQVIEGDVMDAYTITEIDGVRQTTYIVQFTDMLSASQDHSFGGPTQDGYYFITRVYCVGATAAKVRKARSVINQILLGLKLPNISAVHKEFGGGSFALGEANARPIMFVGIAAFRCLTNIQAVGSTVYPETS